MKKLLFFGVVVTATFWFIAWSRFPFFTEHSFFPLWVGYVLTLNGISEFFYGDSLLRRMRLSFVWLFVISIPMWWGFEYLNSIVHNWQYILPHPISNLEYIIRASISFSTVVPAVLSTAFLFSRFFSRWDLISKQVTIRPIHLAVLVVAGLSFFLLVKLFPTEAFPLVWIAPLLLLEPVLYFLGSSSLLRLLQKGEWLLPASFAAGTLFTGFWWEFWNFYSIPKWIYVIPYVDFWRIFEMPILGYGGYPFFGLIIYSYTGLALFLFFRKEISKLFIEDKS